MSAPRTQSDQHAGRGQLYRRDYPATIRQAAAIGRRWPDGLTNHGRPPRTLREIIDGPDDRDREGD